jgi:hypothetical protein
VGPLGKEETTTGFRTEFGHIGVSGYVSTLRAFMAHSRYGLSIRSRESYVQAQPRELIVLGPWNFVCSLERKASQQAQFNILVISASPNSSSLDVQEDTRGAITTTVALCRTSDLAPSSNFVLILLVGFLS